MTGMKKPKEKRKRGQRCIGKWNERGAWKRLPLTEAGTRVKLQFYLPVDYVERMERIGNVLLKMEEETPGKGITRNTPSMFCQYSCRTVLRAMEKMIEDMADNVIKGQR